MLVVVVRASVAWTAAVQTHGRDCYLLQPGQPGAVSTATTEALECQVWQYVHKYRQLSRTNASTGDDFSLRSL